ncbi:hypothetical protein [Actinomadura luteofluorescens]|uniref:GHMP family kinase ATP-binding protein n=1 Tax=Actinomadura luteofluorescens TaxID=46163 RepID=UPI0030CFFFFC
MWVRAPLRADLTGGYTDVEPLISDRPSRSISIALKSSVVVGCARPAAAEPNLGMGAFEGVRVRVRDPRGQVLDVAASSRLALAGQGGMAGMLGRAMVVVDVDAALDVELEMPLGIGVGSSGALLTAACRALLGVGGRARVPDLSLPHVAALVEHVAGHSGGIQDQLAATAGGLCSYRFAGVTVECTPLPQALGLFDGAYIAVPPARRAGSGRMVDLVLDARRLDGGEVHSALRALVSIGDQLFDSLYCGAPQFAKARDLVGQVLEQQIRLHPVIESAARATPMWPFLETGEIVAKPLGGAGPGAAWLILPPVTDEILHRLAGEMWTFERVVPSLTGIRVLNAGGRDE